MADLVEKSADSENCFEPSFQNNDIPIKTTRALRLSERILSDVFKFRRGVGPHETCLSSICASCMAPHFQKVASCVESNTPVTFVLPAFPGKSPNTGKVLGTLPDMAEWCALRFLQNLCDRIQRIHTPGARIVLCSDGRVFSDVVGIHDEHITSYQRELSRMMTESRFHSLSLITLDEFDDRTDFKGMRERLMARYGDSLDNLKASISRGKVPGATLDDQEAHRLYCGITRFLVEDATVPGQARSRTQIQKDSRQRAYEVIRRSQAWGNWVADRFPRAVRLSIHPQACGSKKLGIRLIEPDHWLTPWHGVAVDIGDRFVLMKRAHVEAIGAQLIYRDGRPSHYSLIQTSRLTRPEGATYGA